MSKARATTAITERLCDQCAAVYSVRKSDLPHGRGYYCSRACRLVAYSAIPPPIVPATNETAERRQIEGFSGYYIGADGVPWSCRDNKGNLCGWWKRLAPQRRSGKSNYQMICLRPVPGGKVVARYVHRLVLEAFVGPCPPGMLGCHNDGDPTNNVVTNLRWDTPQNNHADKAGHDTRTLGSRNPMAKRNELDILTLFLMRRIGFTITAIGHIIGMAPLEMGHILRGKKWPHVRRLFLAVRHLAKAFHPPMVRKGKGALPEQLTGYVDPESNQGESP